MNDNRLNKEAQQVTAVSTALFNEVIDTLAAVIAERVLAEIAKPTTSPTRSLPLLDVEAAAERIGLAPSTLYKLAARNALPSVKIGGRLLFESDALDTYVVQHRRGDLNTLHAAKRARQPK